MIGHIKYIDQACQLHGNPENVTWDDRGGELSDLIEEFDVKKDFDINAYINSNIDY